MSVATTIELNDKVSKTLDSIISRLNKVDDKIEIMQNSFDKVDRAAGRAAKGVDGLGQQQNKAVQSAEKLSGAWDKVASSVGAVAAYLTSSRLFGYISEGMDKLTTQRNAEVRLAVSMANMGNDYRAFERVLGAVAQLEQSTPLDSTALTSAAAEFATYLSDEGAIRALLPTYIDYAIGMSEGAPITAKMASEYATQLGKVFTGAFDGIAKKGFKATDMQKELLKTGTDMEKVAVVVDLIAESWDGMGVALQKTPQGKLMKINQAFDKMQEAFVKRLEPSLMKFFDFLGKSLKTGGDGMISFANGLSFVIDKFTDFAIGGLGFLEGIGGFETLTPIIAGLVAMLGVLALVAAGTIISLAGISGPVLLVAGAIGVLVAGIAYAVQEMGGLEIAWTRLVNTVAQVGENFKLIFDSIINYVDEMVNEFLSKIAYLNDKLPTFAKFNMEGEGVYAQRAEAARNRQTGAVDNYWQAIDHFERRLEEATKNTQNRDQTSKEWMEYLRSLFGGDGKPDIGEVGEVKKVGGEINIAKEDLILLRDVAEARFIQNFVTMTPTVNMEVGNINNNMDEETMLDKITSAMENQVAETAEGVF